ncbi:DUF3592 domain-containing protein [Arthrobacter sp. zg-Y769]|uniref:DUF3592 domain-containing protein n=1 Tax=Arthrobacter sp. zg-Y769 TaxID=2894191 RepID=UPI001E5B8DE7|nr:DUF3592 domain-containing protein [Arthrobacter sp. zg-Y769]MCC9205824.1 DUF3592 domain-containing protein [Arthrobacter sp. zg-Y769]
MKITTGSGVKEKLPGEGCNKCSGPCSHKATKPVAGAGSVIAVWIFGIALLSLGLIGGVLGFAEAHGHQRLLSKGTQTVATVTDAYFGSCRKRKTCAFPELTYTSESGEKYTIQGPPKRYRVKSDGPEAAFAENMYGTEFTVFYDPSDPTRAVVEGQESGYGVLLFTLLPIGFGGFIIYVMANVAIQKRRLARRQEIDSARP